MINMIDKLLITSMICFTIGAFMTFGDEESTDLGSGLFLIATSLLCFIGSIILINCQGKNSRNNK